MQPRAAARGAAVFGETIELARRKSGAVGAFEQLEEFLFLERGWERARAGAVRRAVPVRGKHVAHV